MLQNPSKTWGTRQGSTNGLLVSTEAAARSAGQAAGGISVSLLATCPSEREHKGGVAAAAVQDVAQMSCAPLCSKSLFFCLNDGCPQKLCK